LVLNIPDWTPEFVELLDIEFKEITSIGNKYLEISKLIKFKLTP